VPESIGLDNAWLTKITNGPAVSTALEVLASDRI